MKIKLSPETESFLIPSVKTSKNTPKKVADAVIDTVSTVLSCTPATVYSPFIKAVTELAKKAQGLTDSEFGSETCRISFSNLAEPTNGYNGRELFVYDGGSIKWMRTKPDSPASVYFKLKDKYLTIGESLSFDKYEVRVAVKRFKDNGDGSMTDTYTGLQWMKKADGCNGAVTLEKANTCVPSGWRLPTIQELYALCRTDGTTTGLDAMLNYDWDAPDPNPQPNWHCNGTAVNRSYQFQDEGFDVRSNDYWSSTTFASHTSFAWNVDMSYGHVNFGGKSNSHYVWPVRSGH
ncbi:protein kinase [Candidatus Magnetobacterium bavaricum]|uniref:Protein kinase n=1 Tax=Candidatus Magnetobacterium bavaricum TaxID=29290 RepID=A0A0F3GJ45_9BACT|nr:protein kinase [Candidatus Magnetobacterium bavaricum]